MQPKTTHLLAARTPVHEDGGRDHDAPVVTAEKVVIDRQKGEGLGLSRPGCCEGNVVAMVPQCHMSLDLFLLVLLITHACPFRDTGEYPCQQCR